MADAFHTDPAYYAEPGELEALIEVANELVAALRPFADTPIPPHAKQHWPINYAPVWAKYADVKRAREVLARVALGIRAKLLEERE